MIIECPGFISFFSGARYVKYDNFLLFPHLVNVHASFMRHVLSLFTLCNILRRKFVDVYNDEEVTIERDDMRMIRRIMKGKTPHADADPYAVACCCSLSFYIYIYRWISR